MKRILSAILLLAPAAFASDQMGRFESGAVYEPPAAHAPANISRMFTRTVTRVADEATLDLPATGGSGMIIWTIPARANGSDAPVATRLTTPNGSILQPTDRGSLERGLRRFRIASDEVAEFDLPRGAHEVMHVMKSAPANYNLAIAMPQDVAAVTVVAAEPESRITLSSWVAPLSRQPGQPLTFHAELRDGDAAITGARVTARLASPRGRSYAEIELTDDDNDGIYRAVITDLPDKLPGAWQARFEAEGTTAEGTRFARTGSGELVAERGAARLDASSIRTEVIGENLRITAAADVNAAGPYRFDVIFAGAASADARPALAWTESTRTLNEGRNVLTVDVPLALFHGTAVNDLLLDVRLLGLAPLGVAGQMSIDLGH